MTDASTAVSAGSTSPAERMSGVDGFRFIMALTIACLHAMPQALPGFPLLVHPEWAALISICGRFAVPFFFVASGYFLPVWAGWADALLRPVKRLAPVYAFWVAAYYAAWKVTGYGSVTLTPKALVLGSAVLHLWFLPALIGSLIGVRIGLHLIGWRNTFIVAVALAALGPVAFAYWPLLTSASYPVHNLDLLRHEAGPLLVLAGAWMRGRRLPRLHWAVLAGLCVVFGLEEYFVSRLMGYPYLIGFDVLVSSFAMGPASFIIALQTRLPQWLAKLGRYSLGFYCVHIYFVGIFQMILGYFTPVSALAVAVMASGCTTAMVLAMSKVKNLRPVIS